MPTTASNVKKPADRKGKGTKYGSREWNKRLVDLEVPSGELCQVRRPGIQGLIKAGVLHSMDALTGLVQSETLPKAQGKPKVDAKAVVADPAQLEKMMDMIDKIVLYVVVQPTLAPATKVVPIVDPVTGEDTDKTTEVPIPDEEREDGTIYVDEIDINDKTFIMTFAMGGSSDLAEFRKKSEEAVGSVHAG